MNTFCFLGLKDKAQKAYRVKSNDELLLESILPMIEWHDMPDSIITEYLEYLRYIEGKAAIWELDGKYIVSSVNFGDEPYTDGVGSRAICTTRNGVVREFEDWRNNDKIVVIFNNKLYAPDMHIGQTADMLTEVDISMKFNVLYARLYPIPIAKNKQLKAMIDDALNNMSAGKFSTIVDENAFENREPGEPAVDILNLTDVNNSDKIQYLSHFKDDLLRQFFGMYGMNSAPSAKMAQMTESETTQNVNVSMIIPKDRLAMAQKAVDELNAKFGFNCSVGFSECWQSKMEDLDTDDDGTIDEESIDDNNDVQDDESKNIDNNNEEDINDEDK